MMYTALSILLYRVEFFLKHNSILSFINISYTEGGIIDTREMLTA